ncbi:MAG: type II toxin-antitoxin system VapC family toxin [Bryobacteraceae bacterium]
MVLVDTSVWIRALSNRHPFVDELDRLLDRGAVAGHDLVYGELLIGDRGGRKKLLATYTRFAQAVTLPHQDVVAFVEGRSLHGRGVGWIDVSLLASAIVGGLKLWTADPRLSAMANEFGVDYRVPN